jgi:hypothetical protein
MRSSTNVSLYKIAHRNLLRSELCLSGRGLHKIAYSGPVRAVSRWTIEQRNPRRLWPLVARRGRHPRQSLLPDAGNPDRPWRLVDWPISSRVRRRNQSGSPVSAGRRVKDRCTACHRLDHDQAERLRPRRTMQWPFASCDWSLTPAKPMPVSSIAGKIAAPPDVEAVATKVASGGGRGRESVIIFIERPPSSRSLSSTVACRPANGQSPESRANKVTQQNRSRSAQNSYPHANEALRHAGCALRRRSAPRTSVPGRTSRHRKQSAQ